jgi:hypothetical protein
VRDRLVAWVEDCVVRGDVELDEGRLSDQVNERATWTFTGATLEALDDGRLVDCEEVEVDRREFHVIEVLGRRGDPERRLRTVEEPVVIEIGPFTVTGKLHRPPNGPPLAALFSWLKFLPVTDATIELRGADRPAAQQAVVLVNRELIAKTEPLDTRAPGADEPWEQVTVA